MGPTENPRRSLAFSPSLSLSLHTSSAKGMQLTLENAAYMYIGAHITMKFQKTLCAAYLAIHPSIYNYSAWIAF